MSSFFYVFKFYLLLALQRILNCIFSRNIITHSSLSNRINVMYFIEQNKKEDFYNYCLRIVDLPEQDKMLKEHVSEFTLNSLELKADDDITFEDIHLIPINEEVEKFQLATIDNQYIIFYRQLLIDNVPACTISTFCNHKGEFKELILNQFSLDIFNAKFNSILNLQASDMPIELSIEKNNKNIKYKFVNTNSTIKFELDFNVKLMPLNSLYNDNIKILMQKVFLCDRSIYKNIYNKLSTLILLRDTKKVEIYKVDNPYILTTNLPSDVSLYWNKEIPPIIFMDSIGKELSIYSYQKGLAA